MNMFKGLDTKVIAQLLIEYKQICRAYDVDKKAWLTFIQYIALRTGIGIEEQIKLYKVNQKIDKIDEDFNA